MFELTDQQAKIASFNPRSEKHGEDNVLAGDLRIETTMHNRVLDEFDAGLRTLLYRKPAPGEQDDLPLGDGNDLTARKLPHLKPLSWDEDFPGYRLTIVNGLGLSDPLVLTDVELSKFVFEAQDGGSVSVAFRASFHPDADEAGALCALIQDTCEVTLTPPQADEAREAA